MRKLLPALALALLPNLAWAQCNGVFPAHTFCGNATGSPAIPSAVPQSTTAAPAGTNGQVQFNNAGLLGGLTNTQLTADINTFTPTLSGSAPASGGGTVNFLRADGSWTTPPVISTGTPTANQVAQWTNATTVQGVNEASLLSAGNGISITGTTTATIATSLTQASNALGADVALSNVSNYFDGPSMAQGTTGTWFASGTVSLLDTVGAAQFFCKLWDGTTVISSAAVTSAAASGLATMSLSGFLATPAANIRISCRDQTATSGAIKFNQSGNSKDSTVFGFRVQ